MSGCSLLLAVVFILLYAVEATEACFISTQRLLGRVQTSTGEQSSSSILFTSPGAYGGGTRAEERSPTHDRNTNILSSKPFDALCTRRASLITTLASVSVFINNDDAYAEVNTYEISNGISSNTQPIDAIPSLTIPLKYEPSLSAYIISYTVGKSKFGAIIDTGSPFLVVPQTSCRQEYKWGCYRPEESQQAVGLKPTRERFDGNEGWVEWREGQFSFLLDEGAGSSSTYASNTITTTALAASTLGILFPKSSSMTFGVISETLMDGPGGIFLGLVKDTNSWIRPSFLSQSQVTAFSVDLRERGGRQKSLTLYGKSGEDGKDNKVPPDYVDTLKLRDHIPLVKDLNNKYGDPTIHYVGIASCINVNGSTLASTSQKDGKLYVIFDTGCSGMSISPDLFDKQYSLARAQKAKNVWDEVAISFKTASGEEVVLNAKRPITTPLLSDRPWGKKIDGHLIVLGLAYLDGLRMTIDVDDGRLWFDE
jgi:hypothetical protein